MQRDEVLIINFGSQYAHLISRKVRSLRARTRVVSYKDFIEGTCRGLGREWSAVIISGGPSSIRVGDPLITEFSFLKSVEVPVLGICFGHQLIAAVYGGEVSKGKGEYGPTKVRKVRDDRLLEGWGSEEIVWMSHGDHVSRLPEGFVALAYSENGSVAVMRLKDKPVYGVQFHPEVRHTEKGIKLLDNFLSIAGVRRSWTDARKLELVESYVRSELGSEGKVLVAVSGGIDSTVAAVLVRRIAGDRLRVVLIDHGLFREGEVAEVLASMKGLGMEPEVINARDRFLIKLWGVRDCEERRRLIGETFAEIFAEILERDPEIRYFVQGTTYPDVVESGASPGADRIKTHHNVGGLPEWFRLRVKVIEPLKELYKDEVRELGRSLGIPDDLLSRHPFPGPGLAVRVVGGFTPEKLEVVRKASRIVEEELGKAGLLSDVWQAFAVVGDDAWVGVKGDRRALGHVVIIRVVSSEDGMTADWVALPPEVLQSIASRITSELSNVTMVAYAVTPKPPSTIEPC